MMRRAVAERRIFLPRRGAQAAITVSPATLPHWTVTIADSQT